MKSYQVQFALPCENPVDNIRKTRKKDVLVFEVPINTPNCEQLGISDLLRMAKPVELSTVLTGLNNNTGSLKKKQT